MKRFAYLAGALFAASLAGAQESSPSARNGFTIGFGIGAGSGGISCSGCATDRESGFSGYLRLGGAVRPGLIIGGETNGFVKTVEDGQVSFGFYSAVVQWYPQPQNGFFLKGNLGYAASQFVVDDFGLGSIEINTAGFGAGVGAGYDIRLGRMFSVTPYVNALTSFGADAQYAGRSLGEKLNSNLLQFGIGFTWH